MSNAYNEVTVQPVASIVYVEINPSSHTSLESKKSK